MALKLITGGSSITFGLQGGSGVQTVSAQLQSTAEYVSAYIGQPISMKAYAKDADLASSLKNGTVDMCYSGAAFLICQQAITDLHPLLSRINLVEGVPRSDVGSLILTKPGTDIKSLKDLAGKIISIGDLTQISGCQAQWAAMQASGIDLFSDTKAVLVASSQQQVLFDVINGSADAGFAGSETYAQAVSSGIISNDTLAILNGHIEGDYPALVSTALYPTGIISISNALDLNTTAGLMRGLLSITPTSKPALAGGYYGWTAVPDLFQIIELQEALGLYTPASDVAPSKCKDVSDIFSAIVCPPGFTVPPVSSSADSCEAANIACPVNHTCVCNSCRPIPKPVRVGFLTAGQFAVALGLPFLAAILVALACWGRRKIKVNYILFSELKLDLGDVLGKGRQGLVFKARYQNDSVALKRACPRSTAGRSIFDLQTLQTSSQRASLEPKLYASRWSQILQVCK